MTKTMTNDSVFEVDYAHVESVIDTLCEAFYHYPVMRYVLGDEMPEFDAPYRRLISLFVKARVLSGDMLFGIGTEQRLDAAATISLYNSQADAQALKLLREQTWQSLPAAAKDRYDAFCNACAQFDTDAPHIHLNMIGVRKHSQGSGMARQLIEHVISYSNDDAGSSGVSLSTEHAANVPFYEHFGFEMTGHAVVGPGLETWNFFLPKST